MGADRWTSEDIDELTSAGIDVERPSPARVYDYVLGGAHNFAVDRQVAEQLLAVDPNAALQAHANRAFLRRAVDFLIAAGIRQFLDIGSGIPTVGHVHEIAQTKASDSRIAFVDIDPVAVTHSRLILAGNDRTVVLQEDVRRPDRILASPKIQGLLDFEQPVAVLLVALLPYLLDADDPAGIVARLMAPLAPGSYLAVSHATEDGPVDMARVKEIGRRAGVEVTWRTREEVEGFFAGLELVEPGVVWVSQWRPESDIDVHVHQPELSAMYAGVARKP